MVAGDFAVVSTGEKYEVEWKINSLDDLRLYSSPDFSFEGETWCFMLCQFSNKSNIRIHLCLKRISSCGPPIYLAFSFAIKNAQGQKIWEESRKTEFNGGYYHYAPMFLYKTSVRENEFEFSIESYTVIGTLKRYTPISRKDDLEEAHEQLSELIKNNNIDVKSYFKDSLPENDETQVEIVSKSILQLGLEDDLYDPAIMTVSRNCQHPVSRLRSVFGPSPPPPPPAILEIENCGSPKTHSIWSTTPKDSGLSFLHSFHSHNSTSSLAQQELRTPLNSTSDSMFLTPQKACWAEELEKDLLSESAKEQPYASSNSWPQTSQINSSSNQNLSNKFLPRFPMNAVNSLNKVNRVLTREEVERQMLADQWLNFRNKAANLPPPPYWSLMPPPMVHHMIPPACSGGSNVNTSHQSPLVPLGIRRPIIPATNNESSMVCNYGKFLQDLKQLLLNQEHSDVILRVKGEEFPAHKAILVARSPVFASLFRNEMKERKTGIVEIEDCEPSVVPYFLRFLYCNDIGSVSGDNVFDLFKIADKYDCPDLRAKCVDFMKGNLSVETFCEALVISLLYCEAGLLRAVTDFFIKNAKKILVTVKWQTFVCENPIESNELVIKLAASYQVPNDIIKNPESMFI